MVKPAQEPIPGVDAFGFTERNRKTLLAVFQQFDSIKEVVLFGSRAAGTHRPYSDVDICIMNADFNTGQLVRLMAAFEESDLPYFTNVLLFHRLRSEELQAEILHRGKRIYPNAL